MAALFKPLLDELARKTAFWDLNYRKFLDQYPDQFVAVNKSGEVVLTSPDLVDLVHRLERAGLWPGGEVDFEYITTKWDTLIL